MKSVLTLLFILLLPSLAQAGVVKTIYFYPKDRTPQADINTILDTKMKAAQDLFSSVLGTYGFTRRSFELEIGADNKVVVHHVEGDHDDEYYHDNPFFLVQNELADDFTSSDDIHFFVIDITPSVLEVQFRGENVHACGIASSNWSATPAHGSCFSYGTIAHELAHNFGLEHDIFNGMLTSYCSAAWLDKHPLFNGGNTDTGSTQISMLTPQLAAVPGNVLFQFDVSDPDGLYIARVFIDEIDTVVACSVSDENKTSTTVRLKTSYIPQVDPTARLTIMDNEGNYTSYSFDLNTAALLQTAIVPVPDSYFEEILRERTNLPPNEQITDRALAGLLTLEIIDTTFPITDLTGLEHALNLETLTIQGQTSLSDYTPLSSLPALTSLEISNSNFTDLSILSSLTNLQHLNLAGNGITDISVLSGMTALKSLDLQNNEITDVSPLLALSNLESLWIDGNPIADTSLLNTLQRENPNMILYYVPEEGDPNFNRMPMFTEGESAVRWVLEKSRIGTKVGSSVGASDADEDTLTYSLSGHTNLFEINSNTGQLTTKEILDFKTQSTYNVNVSVSDGREGSAYISVTIRVAPVGATIPMPDLIPIYVSFSELMFTSKGGLHSLAQWIELFNSSTTDTVNMRGWQLGIEARDLSGKHRNVIIQFEDLLIAPMDTGLIVTWGARQRSNSLPDSRIYNFFSLHFDEFEQNQYRNMIIGLSGFSLTLRNPEGHLVDAVGNLDGDPSTMDKPAWEMPSGTTPGRQRTSLMRRYAPDTLLPLDGTDLNSWRRSADFPLAVKTHWGSANDIGNPGYRGSGTLPVTLSSFRADLTEKGAVLSWTTESEIDNAGFHILRSETRDGEFKVITSKLIQGGGTTSKRSQYTWTDTTVKPNTRYYYRIEDVSYSGVREASVAVPLRGFITANSKHTTTWAAIKRR